MAGPKKSLKPVYRKIILLNAAIFSIALFFTLPRNREWLRDAIAGSLNDFTAECHHLDEDYRMQYRFDSIYIYSQQIAQLVKRSGGTATAVVLVPPSNYFNSMNIHYHVPEPVVFYYFTGVKTLWSNCTNAADANWYVCVKDGKLAVNPAGNRQALLDTIRVFNTFKPGL